MVEGTAKTHLQDHRHHIGRRKTARLSWECGEKRSHRAWEEMECAASCERLSWVQGQLGKPEARLIRACGHFAAIDTNNRPADYSLQEVSVSSVCHAHGGLTLGACRKVMSVMTGSIGYFLVTIPV